MRKWTPWVKKNVRALELSNSAVVALDCLDGDAELGLHMSEKVSEGGIRVRLKA